MIFPLEFYSRQLCKKIFFIVQGNTHLFKGGGAFVRSLSRENLSPGYKLQW